MSISHNITKALLQLKSLPLELFWSGRCLYIAGDLHPSLQHLNFSNHNLGDDLNLPLVSALSGKHVLPIRYSFGGKRRTYHLVIGSMLEEWSSSRAIVWGAGLMRPLERPIPVPQAVFAVRGPMTRKELMAHGIECPEIYGDPAILLPRIFMPPKSKRNGVALIPHLNDRNHPFVSRWRSWGGIVLDVGQYGDWRKFIRELNVCEAVLSSSLHGLILADAYGIPSRRIILGKHSIIGGDFKFTDYYLSFRQHVPPTLCARDIARASETEIMERIMDFWCALPDGMAGQLLRHCPFLK